MVVEKYFYKTIVEIANIRGYTMKDLANVCETKAETLDKQLRRVDDRDLDSSHARRLQQKLAPNLTLDELYPEAAKEAERIIQLAHQAI